MTVTTIDAKLFTEMVQGAIAKVREQNTKLSALDSAIGDGDHGTTMLRAMSVLEKAIAVGRGKALPDLLKDIGWGLMGMDGGASGALLGSLFLGMSKAPGDKEEIDSNQLAAMFESGLSLLRRHSQAQVGDKTLMDALVPAVTELRAGATKGYAVAECVENAAQAAQAGAESTCNLVARVGRAKNLGQRTLGIQDPGATSIALIFEGFCDGLKKRNAGVRI